MIQEPQAPAGQPTKRSSARRGERTSFYVWTALALAALVTVVVISWHAQGGTTDPTALPPGHRLSHTTVVINSAILVFREGLETILVLAAIMASFLGGNRVYRRPWSRAAEPRSASGSRRWFFVVWLIGRFHGGGLDVQAATGLPAIIVLLLVMNWFFHKVYWTGWISTTTSAAAACWRRSGDDQRARAMLLGLALLGFTSVYREGFEIVDLLAEPARALRRERGARGRGDRGPVHRRGRRADVRRCTSGCPIGGC